MSNYMVKLWATWFTCGNAKKAPGTIGTLGAIPLYLLINSLRDVMTDRIYNSLYFLFLIGFFAFSVKISDIAEKKIYNRKDPQEVVIDEVLGFMTTMFLVNPHGFWQTLITILLGFGIFRLLDITKPGIIDKAQNYKNGLGVVLDDFIAGVFGNVILAIIVGVIWN